MPEEANAILDVVDCGGRRRHQRWLLLTMIGLRFVISVPIAVIASFFPQEVKRWRPISEASLYNGIVTGVFGLSAVIGSVACSQWILKDIGARRLLCLTMFLMGSSTVLFGCLGYTNNWAGFISMSVIIRLIQGFAFGLADVTVYGLGTAASSEQVGLAAGLLELSFGVGAACGPAIGGILYKVGGFGLPLFVVGAGPLISIVVVVTVMTSSDSVESRAMTPLRNVVNVWTVLSAFCGFLINTCLSALVATLGAFLDTTFHMSPAIIGIDFLLTGAWYSMSCPSFGMLAELIGSRWVLLMGLCAISAGLIVISLARSIVPLLIGQVCGGIGLGASFGSVFLDMSKEAELIGQSSSEDRNATLYAILNVCYNVGLVFGATLGGALASILGFTTSTLIVGVTVGMMAVFYLVLSLLRIWYRNFNINANCNNNT